MGNDPGRTLLLRIVAGVRDDLGCEGRLVGRGDTGELGYLAGASLRVETAWVAGLTHLQRALDLDLDKIPEAVDPPVAIAVRATRGDEGGEGDRAVGGEELGDLADANRVHIGRALQLAAGRIEGPGGAAVLLGVNPHTLRSRTRRLGVDWAGYRRR
jgi:hypothetical protein